MWGRALGALNWIDLISVVYQSTLEAAQISACAYVWRVE